MSSTNYFLSVLTLKGLDFLRHEHKHDLDLQQQIRLELHRRGLRLDGHSYPQQRPVDGYERDR